MANEHPSYLRQVGYGPKPIYPLGLLEGSIANTWLDFQVLCVRVNLP